MIRKRIGRRAYAFAVTLAAVIVLAAGSAAWSAARGAAHSGPAGASPAAARPDLTANTNAGCNTPQPAGRARCFAIVRTPSDHKITPDASGPPSTALGPSDIQSAYKLPGEAAGGGQTVAVVDAFGDSQAESDLAAFRSQYGLPACTTANGCFRKVDQTGGTSYPGDDAGWGLETSLDLDAISSACPACNILLVEANDNSSANLGDAVDEAVALGAKFISNSYGGSEGSSELSADQYYNHPGVVVTASAGDGGYGTNYPSASQYVTAVGGTLLTKDSSVARGWDESVWGSASGGEGTGSGCSPYEPKPADQNGVATDCANRATADVSADASPVSGLATYDTLGYGGWLQVGGTSLSSPLIASVYALAGTPAAGTYPSGYPYHDPNQASDLFDITSGANGGCGDVLCQAGPGWDGPTGLGTPDGVAAFRGAPQGQISGQVTDAATGAPVSGATVTANPGDYVTRTDASGNYELTPATGSYTLTAADYGYATVSRSGVQVTAGQTATENFTLTAAPSGTLSGTVTDGSGHGWPLHAQITIPGYPNGPIYTSPYTGAYSVTLPQGSYTLGVTTDYPGYQGKTVQVTVGAGTTTDNITLDADLTACTAPGYGWNGLTEDFTGWTGGTPQDGWTVAGTPAGWRFDNPASRPPPPGGDDDFAVADSGYTGGQMDTTLTSPAVNLSGQSSPGLTFDTAYYAVPRGQSAQAALSTDGGKTWATVWHQSTANALGQVQVPIPQAAGKPDVRVRFRYTGRNGWYWALDGVFVGTRACVPSPGGLIAGLVTSHATGTPVNGAQVTSTATAGGLPWPEGISLPTSDPALPGGFYWLFSPATGSQQFTAAATGYATATATVNVTPDQVTRQDWALAPAAGS